MGTRGNKRKQGWTRRSKGNKGTRGTRRKRGNKGNKGEQGEQKIHETKQSLMITRSICFCDN